MTVQQIMTRAFKDGGAPSDLLPFTDPYDETTFDITLPGAVSLLAIVNAAQLRIATWRFRSGRSLHLRGMLGRLYAKDKGPLTGNVVSATADTVTIEAFATNVDDQFNGWFIEITAGTGIGQIRSVIDSAASGTNEVCTLHKDWDTNPDATSDFALYKNFFKMVPDVSANPYLAYHVQLDSNESLQDILKIRNVETALDLDRTEANDLFTGGIRQVGTPAQFQVYGDEIWFDVANSEAAAYEIIYLKNPPELTLAAQVPAIPAHYHYGIQLWVTHDLHRRSQDFDGAYATKRELEDFMEMSRLPGEAEMERELQGLMIYE